MPTFNGQRTINGYDFSYHIKLDSLQSRVGKRDWPEPGISATFKCLSEVKLDKRPAFAWAKDWWMSYVQTITHDAVFLDYSNDAVYCIRCEAPIKDGDNTMAQVDTRITLFDIQPYVTKPISLTDKTHNALSGSHMNAFAKTDWVPTETVEPGEILLKDIPGTTFPGQYISDDAGEKGQHVKLDFVDRFDKSAKLLNISGYTFFSTWLVVMMNPTMRAVPQPFVQIFGDVEHVPIGPQGMGEFHPLYHFVWYVDWKTIALKDTIFPVGAMRVLHHGPGLGPERPVLQGGFGTQTYRVKAVPRPKAMIRRHSISSERTQEADSPPIGIWGIRARRAKSLSIK